MEKNEDMKKLVKEDEFYRNWRMLAYWYITKRIRGKKEMYTQGMRTVHNGYTSK